MDASAANRPKTAPLAPFAIATAIFAIGLVGVYAFSDRGGALFVAMIENGLAWCF